MAGGARALLTVAGQVGKPGLFMNARDDRKRVRVFIMTGPGY
jgi:hypothetical protein